MLFTIGYQQFFPTLPDCVFQEGAHNLDQQKNPPSNIARYNPLSLKAQTSPMISSDGHAARGICLMSVIQWAPTRPDPWMIQMGEHHVCPCRNLVLSIPRSR